MFGLGICSDCKSIYIKKRGEGGRCYTCYTLFLSMERSRQIIAEELKGVISKQLNLDLFEEGKKKIEEINHLVLPESIKKN